MKTRTALFATTAIVAALAAAGTAIAHPGMGRGMGHGMGMGMGMGPGNCQMQQPDAQCPPGAGPNAGTRQGMGPGTGMGFGMRGGPVGTNLADLKTTLKITAEQESAWNAYAAVVTRHVDARNNMRDKMQALHADPKATLPDLSAMQETMLQFRHEMQTQRTAALKDMYAVLSPEQKALADRNLSGMGGMRGPGMAGPRGGGRMLQPVGYRMGGQGWMGMGMGGR